MWVPMGWEVGTSEVGFLEDNLEELGDETSSSSSSSSSFIFCMREKRRWWLFIGHLDVPVTVRIDRVLKKRGCDEKTGGGERVVGLRRVRG